MPFPVNATKAEIVHDNVVLWSKTVSANAPTVNVTAPNGGSFNAASPLNVTWTANDTDGDALQFGLDYSADNGATWMTINPFITGNSLAWTPGFVPDSNTARVRVRASDGFNTALRNVAPFVLTAQAPKAIILSPDNGATFAEGEVIDLQGLSLTNDGTDAGSFTWQLNGVTVGTTRTITTPLTAIGVNTITLQVNANALSGSRSITVTVIPDYDRDRLPNAWELQHQLNPLDPTDAMGDDDGDTLSNSDEYALGTNPRSSDTDADGVSDNAEIDAGTDPLDPASVPNPNPVLNVGSVSMGFTINDYSPTARPAEHVGQQQRRRHAELQRDERCRVAQRLADLRRCAARVDRVGQSQRLSHRHVSRSRDGDLARRERQPADDHRYPDDQFDSELHGVFAVSVEVISHPHPSPEIEGRFREKRTGSNGTGVIDNDQTHRQRRRTIG